VKKVCLTIVIASVVGWIGAQIYLLDKNRRLTAKKSAAMSAMRALHQACLDYYDEYSQFPLGHIANSDAIELTTGEGPNTLMAILSGPLSDRESGKEKNFFLHKEAKDRKNGLLRNEEGTYAEFFDPWGNPYHIMLDYDYDGNLIDPHTQKILEDTNVLVWSPGPDGKTGTSETHKDDVCSWN